MGAEGFSIDVHRMQAAGNVVLMHRTDNILDAEGTLVDALDMMSMFFVEDGKIVCSRDYFFDSRKFTDARGSQSPEAVARG
jgi:limonene-1,2-epoxide hydrolase